jgi:hypothetical protein
MPILSRRNSRNLCAGPPRWDAVGHWCYRPITAKAEHLPEIPEIHDMVRLASDAVMVGFAEPGAEAAIKDGALTEDRTHDCGLAKPLEGSWSGVDIEGVITRWGVEVADHPTHADCVWPRRPVSRTDLQVVRALSC